MDPNAALASIREWIAARDNATTQAAYNIAEMNALTYTGALLDWLAAGGYAPDWAAHPRKEAP